LAKKLTFYTILDDDIFGLTVSSRYNSDIFAIWNKNADAHENSKVMEKLQKLLEPIELQSPYYKGMKILKDFFCIQLHI